MSSHPSSSGLEPQASQILSLRPLAPIPAYLQNTYWWAYLHPRAVHIFERQWLVNLILWGNFARLRDAALQEMGAVINGRVLQVACVYGDFTEHLVRRLGPKAKTVLPVLVPLSKEVDSPLRIAIIAALGAVGAPAAAALGAMFTMPADQVIAAIGQSVDTKAFADDVRLDLNKDGTVKVDPITGRTSAEWLFAGGDTATGPASVVEAIAAGERAAVGIDVLLSGDAHAFWRAHDGVDTAFDPDADPKLTPRAEPKVRPASDRKGFDEVELPWAAKVAQAEAQRCLRCDYGKSVTRRGKK